MSNTWISGPARGCQVQVSVDGSVESSSFAFLNDEEFMLCAPHFFKLSSLMLLFIPNSLVGWWFGTFFSPYIGNFIIPTDELIFFRGGETTNQFKL